MSGEIHAEWSVVDGSPVAQAITNRDVQFALCHRSENPDAAAYFITTFCRTMDEDRGGAICPIEPKPVTLHVIRTLDFIDTKTFEPVERANIHIKKSRRMLVTWLMCAYLVYRLQFSSNFTALFTSKDEDSVDDGGVRATTDSAFGRMKFIWDHLPGHVRRPLSFAYMRIKSGTDDGYIVGRAPTPNAGRSSGVDRFISDENAHQENAEAIHVSADPMCRDGKVYASTTNGSMNLFAEIDEKKLDGWRFIDVGWEHDAEKAKGIRRTRTDAERDRFGDYVSPWLIRAARSLIDDADVRQEYGRSYTRSNKGVIFREFSRDRHVRRPGALRYDPAYPLALGADFGMARKTVLVFVQPKPRILSVIGVYMGEHRNAPDNAREAAAYVRSLGYKLPLDEIDCIPDPSALNEEPGSGLSLWSWYRKVGFSSHRPPYIVGPDSVMLGNSVLRWLFKVNGIEFAYECGDPYFKALENYRLPLDKTTGEIKSNVPIHDMASHPSDGTRYVATGFYTAEDIDVEIADDRAMPERAPVGEGALLDRAGRTMRQIRGGADEDVERRSREPWDEDGDDDSDWERTGVGARTMTSSLENMRF